MIRRYAVAFCVATALAPNAQAQEIETTTYSDAGYASATAAYGADYAGPEDTADGYAQSSYDNVSYERRGFLGLEILGHGRLSSNDLLGDGKDRWQTGSVSTSRVVGRSGWTGVLPEKPFDIIEYRLAAQVMAPQDMRNPEQGDRPWGGAVTFGVHTHFMRGPVELSMGGDLVITGPQTGLGSLQTAIHDVLGQDPASISVLSDQIENDFHPTLVLEAANSISVGGQAVLRPFAEARAGVETMVRVGADLTIGTVGRGELLIRDAVTGQRYRSISAPLTGFSYVVGGDMAYVDSSAYLPEDRGYELSGSRNRMRAGVHWQGERSAAFYGLTYLSKEFEAQDTGQTVGSVRLDFKF